MSGLVGVLVAVYSLWAPCCRLPTALFMPACLSPVHFSWDLMKVLRAILQHSCEALQNRMLLF